MPDPTTTVTSIHRGQFGTNPVNSDSKTPTLLGTESLRLVGLRMDCFHAKTELVHRESGARQVFAAGAMIKTNFIEDALLFNEVQHFVQLFRGIISNSAYIWYSTSRKEEVVGKQDLVGEECHDAFHRKGAPVDEIAVE